MRGEFIEVDGHRLYYYAAGTRGSGDPIVLLHGFPATGHLWSGLVPLLPHGRRIVVPDLLGCGRSDSDARADLSIAAHADRVGKLLEELGIKRVAIVGHHAGALVGATVALRLPGLVTHLAMLHPIGGDVTWTGTFAVIQAFYPLAALLPESVVQRAIRREIARWYDDPARGRTSVDLYLRSISGPRRWPAFLAQVRSLTRHDVIQCTAALAGLSIPCAILGGDRDPAVPRVAIASVCNAVPRSTLDIIRDSHHYSPEESPERVARVIAHLLVQ